MPRLVRRAAKAAVVVGAAKGVAGRRQDRKAARKGQPEAPVDTSTQA